MAWVWRDWEVESPPKSRDLLLIPAFAVVFPVVRFVLDRSLFELFGRKTVFRIKEDDTFRKTLKKFKESAWKCTYFTTAALFAVLITYKEPWFRDTRLFWMGPGDQVWPDLNIKLKLKLLYVFSGGFYVYSILALVFWETRRRDFGVSMSHHIATFLLIVLSYPIKFTRVGSVVLALHDSSDIFLEIAKMSRYAGSDLLSGVFFALFAVSWLLLRVVYFPFWIIWSTSYESVHILDKDAHKDYGPTYYYAFNTFLISLYVLHVYWWILIIRVLQRQFEARGKIEKDVRSDSENEDED